MIEQGTKDSLSWAINHLSLAVRHYADGHLIEAGHETAEAYREINKARAIDPSFDRAVAMAS